MSPFVSALLAEDPDVIYLQATLSGTKIADALQQADYDGVIISPSFSPLLLGQPGYEGILINTQVGVDPEIEGLAHLLESVHAIKPDQQLSLALITGYLAADMFIKGLEETGEDLTVENFLATMNGGFTYSVDGVVGESTWPDNHSKPVPCSVLTKTENAQFVPFQALQCGTNIDVK